MPIAAPSSPIVLRGPGFFSDHAESDYGTLEVAATHGIVLGKGLQAHFKLYEDADVDAAHGTLECTRGRGVWVYTDHSRHGSLLNGQQRVHNDAVVVHHGDWLTVGRTEVTLSLERDKTALVSEDEKRGTPVSHGTVLSARNVARMARRRASTSSGSAAAMSKLQQAKERLPRIETSGLDFDAGEPRPTSPESTVSPGPGTRSRGNVIAKTVAVPEKMSLSPLLEQRGHVQSFFRRPHVQFEQGLDMPFTSLPQQLEVENAGKNDRPPPLEYSSSPAVSPSSLAARQRYHLSQRPPTQVLVPVSGLIDADPPPPISTGTWPSSRRDDLRIQVSKKMAAAAPVGAGKLNIPCVVPRALEFQPPASPVAQKDLLKQQETLQIILQHKSKEEQLLKQQQEEWMRQNLTPVSSNDNELLSSTLQTPQLSAENVNRLRDTDPDELELCPSPAPGLIRTLSLGHSQQCSLKSSPRLSAATQVSRARLNSFEERPNESRCYDRTGCRKTTALVRSPSTIRKREVRTRNSAMEIELRSSDESIVSTASTVMTCHRRVTSSLSSSCTSSVGLCDFLGYEEEEDTGDMVTSYTSPDSYGSAELPRTLI